MSISDQIARLQRLKERLAKRLNVMGIVEQKANIETCVQAIEAMPNNGSVIKVLDTTTKEYKIIRGYHSGQGAVKVNLEEKTAKANGEVIPTKGKVLSKVIVNVENVPIFDNWTIGEATIMSSPKTKAPDATTDETTTYIIIPNLTTIPKTIYLEWTEEDSYGQVYNISALIDKGKLVKASWNKLYIGIVSIDIVEQGIKITFNAITHSRAGVVAKYMYNNTFDQDYTSEYHITKAIGRMPDARSGATVIFYKNKVEQDRLGFQGLTDTEERSVDWDFDLSKDFIDFFIVSARSYDRVGFKIDGNTIYFEGFIA